MMKTKEKQMTFNGWTNRETWLVSLWYGGIMIDMEADGNVIRTADQLRDYVTDMVQEDAPESGLVADFVNAALSAVNWEEFFEYCQVEEAVDSMDGDAASALASAGFGTDEDYGYTGDIDDRG